MRIISVLLAICLCCPIIGAIAAETSDSMFKYEIEDGKATILGFEEEKSFSHVIIPSKIDGYEVNKIGDYAFALSNIKSISFEENIKDIGAYAFNSCEELEDVVFPESLEKIENGAFMGCTSITKIECPLNLKKIENSAFSLCNNIQNLYLNEGLEEIGGSAFSYCDKLKGITIPSTVKILSYGGRTPIIEYCSSLETIEVNCKLENPQIFVADCPNLKKIIFSEDIGDFDYSRVEFLYNFYKCEPRDKRVNPRVYTEALNITIQGRSGSNIEKFAEENDFKFIAIESEENYPISDKEKVNFESKYDISQFMDSSIYTIYDVFDTDYGAVLYYSMGGFMGAPGPGLSLVRENGEVVNLSIGVSKKDLYRRPEHNDITLSEDGKYVTFNVSFDERAEGPEGMLGGNLVVYHDAGAYYYKADLETGVCIETKFEPFDTISEEIISAWAKTEVESAIALGFVPITIRENYKRNITRAEFTRMAMYFLSVQYGYQPEHILRTYYNMEKDFPLQDFLSAYCSAKKDRNGNDFINDNTGEKWNYEEKRSGDIFLQYYDTIFTDLNNENLFENTLINIAYNMGIVNGVSENTFNPNGNITRQEAATMLMRVYRNYAEFGGVMKKSKFSDDEEISDWAKDDVYSINTLGVMQGVGEDVFAPKESYTVEQAIATFLRLYESAPISRKNKNIASLLENEKEIYFIDNPGLTSFEVTSEDNYGEYTIITGTHWRRHGKGDNKIYVFYSYGGMRDLLSFVPIAQENNYEIEEMEVNSNENVIKFNANVSDTFRLYNKLNGAEKVYGIGKYRIEIDLVTGNIVSLIRIG